MKFSRTYTTLEALEHRDGLTVTDALNMFYDLCADMKDAEGQTVDKLGVGDGEEMVTRLAWLGRTFMRIYGRVPEDIFKEDKGKRLEKTALELKRVQEELEKAEEGAAEWRERREELSESQKALAAKVEEQKKLRRECKELEAKLTDYENTGIPELEVRLEALKEQTEACFREYGERKSLCAEAQKKFLEAKSQKDSIDREIESVRKQEEKLQKEIEEKREKHRSLKKRLLNSDARVRSLAESIETLEKTLSYSDIENLTQLYEQKKQEAETRRRKCASLTEEINKLKSSVEAAERDIKKRGDAERRLRESLERAERDKETLFSRTEALEREKAELDGWFAGMDAASFRKRFEESRDRVACLREAREALGPELELLYGLISEEDEMKLKRSQAYFKDKLLELENGIGKYQESYRIVMDLFEKGGNGL